MLKIIRTVLFTTWFLGLGALMIPIFLLKIFKAESTWPYLKIMRPVGQWLINLKIIKREWHHATTHRPCVFVANHQSNLDVLTVGTSIPKGTAYLMKHTLFWLPIFGVAGWVTGQFFINRKNHKKAMETMKLVRKKMEEDNSNLLILPEGTRNKKLEGLLPFKKGAFHLALSTKSPIVPLVLSSYRLIDANKWDHGTVLIEALPPIPTKDLKKEDIPKLIEEVRSKMLAKHNELNALLTPPA